jgi:hypothetical protein
MSRRHRRPPVQLYLNFLQLPLPLEVVWEQLEADDQAAVVEALAQLLTKATMDEATPEEDHD